jgi:hypothetical protein
MNQEIKTETDYLLSKINNIWLKYIINYSNNKNAIDNIKFYILVKKMKQNNIDENVKEYNKYIENFEKKIKEIEHINNFIDKKIENKIDFCHRTININNNEEVRKENYYFIKSINDNIKLQKTNLYSLIISEKYIPNRIKIGILNINLKYVKKNK